jgi:hypothetical protein
MQTLELDASSTRALRVKCRDSVHSVKRPGFVATLLRLCCAFVGFFAVFGGIGSQLCGSRSLPAMR